MKIIMMCISLFLLSGCASTQYVSPVDSKIDVKKIYIEEYGEDSNGVLDGMVLHVKKMGYEVETYKGNLPENAVHYMGWNAVYLWDMATYLHMFRVTMYENGKVLGEANYYAPDVSISKFGSPSSKISPLLTELLKNTNP